MANHQSTPVVLLHAYPLNARMWSSLQDRLGDRSTLAPDFPGFGSRSPRPANLDAFAGAVIEEMDRAGIARAVFVGLSMGGYVAFRLWARHPERVAGMVLADTRAGPDSEAAAEKRLQQAERARTEGISWVPEEMLGAVLGESTRRDRPDVVEIVRKLMLEATPEGVARALLAMRERPDSRPLLPTIDVPVLVLVGEEDQLTGIEESRTIAEGVPGAELKVIPRAGHLSNLENPEAFEGAVLEFLG
ncbi:MAG TPA: alpha/beta fold hydrolase [Longimicrobiaceae bacterium]|nr:alpha/beta fold hydrolase [Longimicrobiaceae bacterium]